MANTINEKKPHPYASSHYFITIEAKKKILNLPGKKYERWEIKMATLKLEENAEIL